MSNARPARWRQACAAIFGLLVLGLAITTCITSSRWVGTIFPGFFVLSNQVVASVSLPHWSVASQQQLYQHAVVAVNGQQVHSPAEIYTAVRSAPSGSTVRYTVEEDGRTTQVALVSQHFSVGDYCLVFGAYLFTGLVSIAIGIAVWVMKPGPASVALLFQTGTIGIFFLTAMDLYAPHWFFRLHILSETLIGASSIHLALVFPVDRRHRFRTLLLTAPYIVSMGLNAVYQGFLYNPEYYSYIHSLSESYAGLSLLPFVCNILWEYYKTTSHLIRQRIRIISVGFLGAFAFPAALAFLSGIMGGGVTVNYSVFTMFLFPLSLGYAIVKHDLFEIDIVLKRATYYLTLTAILTLSYVVFLSAVNWLVRSWELTQSPMFSLLYTIIAVLLLNPLKDRLQQIIDRLFFRLHYDAKKVLETTSSSLAATLHLDAILSCVWNTISETMGVLQGGILLRDSNTCQYRIVYPSPAHQPGLPCDHPLVHTIELHAQVVSVYDVDEEETLTQEQEAQQQALGTLHAQLLVPLIFKGDVLGLIAVGQKESGQFFSADDRNFLHTLANQSALSIANALSYREIEELNSSLEQKVEQRTQELANTNSKLSSSLAQLEQAYRDLENSQDNLVRAEKMAALGRLTAGIAHEMNTPLGASLTAMKLLQELIDEYTTSIGDADVNDEDHRDIATEMAKTLKSTRDWVEKAASHIRSLKSHTRALHSGHEVEFSVLQAIEDTGMLVAHRLRLSECTLTTSYTAVNPVIKGDPGKLGQVLANLVVNSIDAYKAISKSGGEIRIAVHGDDNELAIQVADDGSGIPTEHLSKIFDELFTTKPVGEGTGLGLSISHDIITNFFGGTISVESVVGQRTTFTLHLPRQHVARLPRATASSSDAVNMPSISDWVADNSSHQAV
jgi:signal transduction histidine kinase